jgi:hypothetical protein
MIGLLVRVVVMLSDDVLQVFAARPAIHEATPVAAKNSTAFQASGS